MTGIGLPSAFQLAFLTPIAAIGRAFFANHFSKLHPSTLRGLQRAMIDGLGLLRQVSVAGGNTKIVNHWAYGQTSWGRTAKTNDFLTRSANQSFSGMMEHWIEEVTKLRAHHDSEGNLLDGSTGNYTLHFTKECSPSAPMAQI